MLALHAAFDRFRLVVWGETESEPHGDAPESAVHPFHASPELIRQTLKLLQIGAVSHEPEEIDIYLPTFRGRPVPSSRLLGEVPEKGQIELRQWQMRAIELTAAESLNLLTVPLDGDLLAPGVLASPDLAYWSMAMRFAGVLVARGQFLPDLIRDEDTFYGRWRAVCAGKDDEARTALLKAMPPSARSLAAASSPSGLLNTFLDYMLDEIVRGSLPGRRWSGEGLHERWLVALHAPSGTSRGPVVRGTRAELEELHRLVREWRRPVSISSEAPFRLCFRLQEPEKDQEAWGIHYLLQSRTDPSLIVPAETVWKKLESSPIWKYTGWKPREHLLLSLGQASAICPRIEQSLQSPAPDGYSLDATGAHDFLSNRAMALEEAGFGVMLPAWWTRKGTKSRVTAGIHVTSPFAASAGLTMNAVLSFEWEISVGGDKITPAELKALANAKEPLVKFRGQWVQLNASEIQAALDFWKKKGKGQITAREAVRMAVGAVRPPASIEFSGVTAEGWVAGLVDQLEGRVPFAELPPPEGLRADLRPYQVRGYSWLSFLQTWGLGACLADDMGLGKTIQTLSLIQRDYKSGKNGNPGPVLLVCPTSVVGNWEKEADRFTPELPVLVHHGGARARGSRFAEDASRHAVVISSYSLLHRDYEFFREVRWHGVVLDEAQNIKNPETKQAKAARSLEAGYRIALTGTPVENNVGDLWSVMEFLNPGLLGSREEFRKQFFLPIQTARDPEATGRLRKLTGPFILRRLKTDKSVIRDLPAKLETKTYCNLTKEQGTLYAAVVKNAIKALQSKEGIQRKGIVLATLTRLKQVCNHPVQFLADNSALHGRSGKLSRMTEMLEEALSVGDRVLVFTQFAEMGFMLQRSLQERFGREVLFLHGAVPKKQRDVMVARFQEEAEGPPVFVLSLKAGGTGLNLTRANHVFHFDRWWNPAVENQATDRAFRIGQTRSVQVHKLICAGTLEDRIDEMIEGKSEIASGIVGTGEGWLTELSTAQLRDLFELRSSAVAE